MIEKDSMVIYNGRKKTVSIILIKIMYVILLVFPFSISTIYGLVAFFGDWEWLFKGHNKVFYFMPEFGHKVLALVMLAVISVAIGLIIRFFDLCYKYFSDKGKAIESKLATVIAIFLLTIIARMFLFFIFKNETQPFSDFQSAWDRANGNMETFLYYSFFPGYINYSLIEKIISCLTGANYEAILCFCILCNGITSLFIFLITDSIFNKYELSFLASVLYAINPSSIVYALSSTPEHMAITCFTGSIYFICKFYDAKKASCKIRFLIIAGIMGGIGNSVKTFFPIILVAIMIVFILGELRRNNGKRIKKISFLCLSIMVLFLTQIMVTNIITAVSQKVFDVELNFSDATPHYLNVGLNRKGEGQIHVGDLSRLYIQDRIDGVPLEEATANAIDRVVSDWKGNITEVPAFFVKKTIWGWQDDCTPFRYFLTQMGIKPDTFIEKVTYKGIASLGVTYAQLWYILSMVLGIVGTVFTLRKKNVDMENMKFALSNLVILGYFCLTVLSEAQSRYKCLIVPFVCIMNAFALMKIYGIFRDSGSSSGLER